MSQPGISYGPNARRESVSPYTLGVLRDVCRIAGIEWILISSTERTPDDQARVMYFNCAKYGASSQYRLYGPFGDRVVDVYQGGRSEGWGEKKIIQAMADCIRQVGPSKVSRHCADPRVLNVVDIAPYTIPDAKAALFVEAVRNDKRVTKLLTPPKDPAFHLEVKQPTE
jgi:hypothetical protein